MINHDRHFFLWDKRLKLTCQLGVVIRAMREKDKHKCHKATRKL